MNRNTEYNVAITPYTVYLAASSMITSMGYGVEDNVRAIAAGLTGLCKVENPKISQHPMILGEVASSVFPFSNGKSKARNMLTDCISTVLTDLRSAGIDSVENLSFVIATAKGSFDGKGFEQPYRFAEECVRDAVSLAGLHGEVGRKDIIVESNACVSGVSAMIIGKRIAEDNPHRYVVVAGVEMQENFITSGFASFKSLSKGFCKPYDKARDGLNLGEGCGAVLLTTDDKVAYNLANGEEETVILSGGAMSDDANHLSGPSRTGQELCMAMQAAMSQAGIGPDDVSFLQMHGTGTAYNDDMESKAANLAGLQEVPCQSLKPCFGHTMGAAGVIESIICAEQLSRGELYGVRGFCEPGTAMPLNVSAVNRPLDMRTCVKTASGFGGTNAAIVLEKAEFGRCKRPDTASPFSAECLRSVSIADGCVKITDALQGQSEKVFGPADMPFADFIRAAHQSTGDRNLKFFKMDDICKLGYITAHFLLDGIGIGHPENVGVMMTGHTGSLDTDNHHLDNITRNGDDMASPSVFVYTLPNTVGAEIAIKYGFKGENTFYYLTEDNGMSESADVKTVDIQEYMDGFLKLMMAKSDLEMCVVGVIDFINGEYFSKFDFLKRI